MEPQDLNRGAKIYHKNNDYTISEFTYIRRDGASYIVEDSFGVVHKLSYMQISSYNFSKRMILTELEEELRGMITVVHDSLREMNIKFNPIPDIQEVKLSYGREAKEVHQYHEKTGRYLMSFKTVTEASKYVRPGCKWAANISHNCLGRRSSAYGFKWSYEKRKTY